VCNKDPDWSLLPEHYSEKTKDFIRLFLNKDWAKRPLIKDIIDDLEAHAEDLFQKADVKIKFPPL